MIDCHPMSSWNGNFKAEDYKTTYTIQYLMPRFGFSAINNKIEATGGLVGIHKTMVLDGLMK